MNDLLMDPVLGRIVGAATAGPQRGAWARSAVRCRRRPGRKACDGRLEVMVTDVPDQVRYRCPACTDSGQVPKIAGGIWDRSRWAREGGERTVRIPYDEYDALVDIETLDAEDEALVLRAEGRSADALIVGTEEQLEHLAESVAGELNHMRSSKKRRACLERAYDRILAVL